MSTLTEHPTEELRRLKARLGIVGNAPALLEAVARARRVAPYNLSVLVTGESGVGKEFFPKIIHQHSPRKHATYIAVNCGAIPEGTIDSELFGHEKGAFTGAVATRKGYFEEADGGTIFLDEVAELPRSTQARLLRVLESGEYLKVGSSQVQRADVRIVAATNVPLLQAVAEGRFREDLYYRLSTVQIAVPPLRERGSDTLLLAARFADEFAERYRTPAVTLSADAADALLRYRWPGNVRQLKNVVEQIALFHAGEQVEGADVEAYLQQGASGAVAVASGGDGGEYRREREMLLQMILALRSEVATLKERLDTLQTPPPTADILPPAPVALVKYEPPVTDERETIRQALERNMGRRRATALELGMPERTLYRKIKEYGLE